MAEKPVPPKAEASLDDLRADLEKLRDDFARLLEAAGKGAQASAESVAAEASVKANAAAEAAGEWAQTSCTSVRGAIRGQPLLACAVAAGAGLLLGQILLRR